MSEVSVAELNELFVMTVSNCSSRVLGLPDEELECTLFEDCDADVHSFLHEDNLRSLCNAGFVNDEIVTLAQSVRDQWLTLTLRSWRAGEVRGNREWRRLFETCDAILTRIDELNVR